MAALFDTSVAVLLLRRKLPAGTDGVVRAARAEIAAGTALLPAVATCELLLGERGSAVDDLSVRLSRLPTAILSPEAAGFSGSMGAFLASRRVSIPIPDLLIAGTAVWLDVPLLAWDADYARARDAADASREVHEGAGLWKRLQLHPATLGSRGA